MLDFTYTALVLNPILWEPHGAVYEEPLSRRLFARFPDLIAEGAAARGAGVTDVASLGWAEIHPPKTPRNHLDLLDADARAAVAQGLLVMVGHGPVRTVDMSHLKRKRRRVVES